MLKDADPRYDTLHIPTYKRPGMAAAGKLWVPLRYQDELRFRLYLTDDKRGHVQVSPRDYYVNHLAYLSYYEQRDGYLKVACESSEAGLWIKEEDISRHFKVTTFMEFFLQHRFWNIDGYHDFRLRSEPVIESGNELLVLHWRQHKLWTFTGKTQGAWAEATFYEVHPPALVEDCFSEEQLKAAWTGKQWTGWIKIMDDDLRPSKSIHVVPIC